MPNFDVVGYDETGNAIYKALDGSYFTQQGNIRTKYTGKLFDRKPGDTKADPNIIPPTQIGGPTNTGPSDRQQIEDEATREKQQTLDAVNQAADMRTKGIGSLGDILLKHNQAQFNYDLPGIKEDLSNSGLFTSPSALAAAVTRESGMLGANSQSILSQAGLGNIDLQAEGLLGATQNQNQMQQGGLQRQFSLTDYDKQAQLAREIGAMTVPNAPSPFQSAFGSAASGAVAGSAFGPHGAAVGAGLGGLAGLVGSNGGGGK